MKEGLEICHPRDLSGSWSGSGKGKGHDANSEENSVTFSSYFQHFPFLSLLLFEVKTQTKGLHGEN